MISFRGHCTACEVEHLLPTSEHAINEARRRIPIVRDKLGSDKGRMIGVLVGEDHLGRKVVLQAFSGTTDIAGIEIGWAPTTRHVAATSAREEDTFERLNELSAQIQGLGWSEVTSALNSAQGSFEVRKRALLEARKRAKTHRDVRRQTNPDDSDLEWQLRQESWDESVAHRRTLQELRVPIQDAKARYAEVLDQIQALKVTRRALSNRLQTAFNEEHSFTNFRGVSSTLDDAHLDTHPMRPGVGECAAPKLLQDAARRGVRPVAMAEVWVGNTQTTPKRVEGQTYPPCEERCRPIFGHLLCGSEKAASLSKKFSFPLLAEGVGWVAVAKPNMLLATPGRGPDKVDSVVSRIRSFYGTGASAQAAHRLDFETSGVMLVALSGESQAALQAQFSARTVEKQYLAWVEGIPRHQRGQIELPLGPESRHSRKQHVTQDGKASVTDYTILGSKDGHALVLFRPVTGRTHQLRVHAANEYGLNTPIVGDDLYGHAGPVLRLHAWRLTFIEPESDQSVSLMCPIPQHWPPETMALMERGMS